MRASSAASLRRLRVSGLSAALSLDSRMRFALASIHFRIDTFRSCPRKLRARDQVGVENRFELTHRHQLHCCSTSYSNSY